MRILFAALAVTLIGCSGGSGDDARPASRRTVAQIAADIPCSPTFVTPEAFVSDEGECTYNGEALDIVLIEDEDRWYGAIKTIACPVFQVDAFYAVDGDGWAVSPQSEAVAHELADKLDADVRTINC